MEYKKLPHRALDIYNMKYEKVCGLYDSSVMAEGQAYDIACTIDSTGWKEIRFTMPYLVDGKKNYRWDYIRNEFLLRVLIGNKADWYIIRAPKKTKNNKNITTTVTCDHVSSTLKTRNVYLVFDDSNGIGKIEDLANTILAGTGWT